MEVNAVIENLCNKFGVTVDYLLPKIVRYVTVMSAAGVIIGVLIIIACVIALKKAYKVGVKWSEEPENKYDEWWEYTPTTIILVVCSSLAFIAVFMIFVNTYHLVSVLASPEVAALKYVGELLK